MSGVAPRFPCSLVLQPRPPPFNTPQNKPTTVYITTWIHIRIIIFSIITLNTNICVCKIQWSFLSRWQLCLLHSSGKRACFCVTPPPHWSGSSGHVVWLRPSRSVLLSPSINLYQTPRTPSNRKTERLCPCHKGGGWCSATGQLWNGTDLQWDQQISHKKRERLISSPRTMAANSCLIATGSSSMATRSHRSRGWQGRCSPVTFCVLLGAHWPERIWELPIFVIWSPHLLEPGATNTTCFKWNII